QPVRRRRHALLHHADDERPRPVVPEALPDGVPMTQAAPPPPARQPLRSSGAHNRWRELRARAFKYTALAATLFGLVMLVVFFVGLARDVAAYFRVMPGK